MSKPVTWPVILQDLTYFYAQHGIEKTPEQCNQIVGRVFRHFRPHSTTFELIDAVNWLMEKVSRVHKYE